MFQHIRLYLILVVWLAFGFGFSFMMAHLGQPGAVWFWRDVLGLVS